MAVAENDGFLSTGAQKGKVRIEDADHGILQVWIALNQVGQEISGH